MSQLELFKTTKLDARFEKFHKDNPKIMELFLHFARQAKDSGLKRMGAKAIMERIRWHISVDTIGSDFKCNNSYTSRYARLAVKEIPELKGLFEMRELRS